MHRPGDRRGADPARLRRRRRQGWGDSDERVLGVAEAAGRVVITPDWGLGEMIIRHGQTAAGVIILSLYALSAGARERYAVEKVAEFADQSPGCLTIIEPWRVRTRRLTAP